MRLDPAQPLIAVGKELDHLSVDHDLSLDHMSDTFEIPEATTPRASHTTFPRLFTDHGPTRGSGQGEL